MTNKTTKLCALGDVHGAFGNMRDAMDNNPDCNHFIQVGDMGVFWDGREPWGHYVRDFTLDKQVSFIGGNHDNWDFLRCDSSFRNQKWPKNLFYIPNASHWNLPTPINFMGGANSIDKHNRIEGMDWWPGEIPPYSEFQAFADLPHSDVWITHTCPTEVAIRLLKNGNVIPDPVSNNLQQIWDNSEEKPKIWLFGHWHQRFDEVIKGTRFICIPCVHEFDGEQPNNGVVLTIENKEVVDVKIQ